MANQVAKMRRETIVACITCALCGKLFREATTISECLHTFCRKCIYDKLSDEELEYYCCPICNIDLGCVPLEKLRPDHNLQDLRAKLFPSKRKKVETPEVLAVTLPGRRKERSLSAIVVSMPKVSNDANLSGRKRLASERIGSLPGIKKEDDSVEDRPQSSISPERSNKSTLNKWKQKEANVVSSHRASGNTTTTGRRRRTAAERIAAVLSMEKDIRKEEDTSEDLQDNLSSPERPIKFTQKNRKNAFTSQPRQQAAYKEAESGTELLEGNLDLWKPLNCLVEVANSSKSFENSRGSCSKVETPQATYTDAQLAKIPRKKSKCKSKVLDEKNSPDPASSEIERPHKMHRVRQKKKSTYGESSISPQSVLDSCSAEYRRRVGPIWFSLVASEDQDGDRPLPQIPAKYLRVKNGDLTVSFIQKYLMRKLDLTSEAEVEIMCMGQPVVPTLRLSDLVDLWLQTVSPLERYPASVGSTAKDFMMVLAYARKILSS